MVCDAGVDVYPVWLIVVVICGGVAWGCDGEPAEQGERLRLGVAASLAPSVERFVEEYARRHPGTTFDISIAGSNTLARQALADAPFDILLLASSDLMDRLADADILLPDSRRTVGTNRLCLIVPTAHSSVDGLPERLEDLADSGIERIGIGSPGVPAGEYAREALERRGLLRHLEEKFVFGTNVRQVLVWVETGEVDCGFVYVSDTVGAEEVRIALVVDENLHAPIRYEGAVLRRSESPAPGVAWLEAFRRSDAEGGPLLR